jgi:predicted lactoylglutathione lyase
VLARRPLGVVGREDDLAYPRFFTGHPFNGQPAGVGNGAMTAFLIEDSNLIDRLYTRAMENGGADECRPGFRPQYGDAFYSAYVRDPDGNKLAFVCYEASR